jgi:hypothetical protein
MNDEYGKIYFYNGFLFISASEVGIHILDNTNPSHPRIIGFIELVGECRLGNSEFLNPQIKDE